MYLKTNNPSLHSFLRNKFASWAGNESCMKEIWKSFKETVFKSIDYFVPHKILRKNPDPEYYNKEVKQLKAKSKQQEKIRTVITSGTEKTI